LRRDSFNNPTEMASLHGAQLIGDKFRGPGGARGDEPGRHLLAGKSKVVKLQGGIWEKKGGAQLRFARGKSTPGKKEKKSIGKREIGRDEQRGPMRNAGKSVAQVGGV